jgi:hypothetical protein
MIMVTVAEVSCFTDRGQEGKEGRKNGNTGTEINCRRK